MFTTADDAKAVIIESIENGAATRDEFDIDKIFDATFEWDGRGFSQVVGVEDFWLAVEQAAYPTKGA